MNAMCNNMMWTFGETQDHVGRFDIAMAHDWMTGKALVQVKNTHKIPCTFTFHSTERGRCLGGCNETIRAWEGEAAFVADRVIAVSDKFKNEVMGEYEVPEAKCWVVPNGIQCSKYDGAIDCAEVKGRYGVGCLDPMILFVGRMGGGLKGSDLIVEAMPEIIGAHGCAKAVFVGDGDAKMHCDHRSKELGVDGSCRFLGPKHGQELVDLYKACDVVVVPSRNEPFGLIVLEAWAAGKPVIVSDQVGCPVNHWEEGLVVSCASEGIAWACAEIFNDFDRAREMGRKGRVKAAFECSWDKAASIQEACLEDVLKYDRMMGA
jgi:glycosyltransferase involved in cell wall biosynthesis